MGRAPSLRMLIALSAIYAAAQACSDVQTEPAASGATASGSGSAGAGAGTSDSSVGGASSAVSGGGTNATAASGAGMGGKSGASQAGAATGGGGGCASSPGEDNDKDGYSIAQGDCNDCDPHVNPSAIDEPPMPNEDGGLDPGKDSNCDGTISPPDHCDGGVALDSLDPFDAAKAIGLCPSKFLLGAKWVLADGSDPPSDGAAPAAFHLGHGNLPDLGAEVLPQEGKQLLLLSSGTARRSGDLDFVHESFDKGYVSPSLPGFSTKTPACPAATAGPLHDATALEVDLRAPANVYAFSFDFDFFSAEWPTRVCASFDDAFVAWMTPFPLGFTNGDIAYEPNGNLLSVNNALFDVCGCPGNPPGICAVPPGAPMPQKDFNCSLGPSGVAKTDWASDDADSGWTHAATGWLVDNAPINPGDTFTVRFVIYDAEDGKLDSAVAIDNWQWSTKSPNVVTDWIPPPK